MTLINISMFQYVFNWIHMYHYMNVWHVKLVCLASYNHVNTYTRTPGMHYTIDGSLHWRDHDLEALVHE